MNPTKLQQLKSQLSDLENSLPQGETLSLIEQILGDKSKDLASSLKEDTSLQGLDSINNKLDKFKQDFNLDPIISVIEEMQKGMQESQTQITSQFDQHSQASQSTKAELQSLIESTKNDLQGMTGQQISEVLTKITNLENQLSFQNSTSKTQGQTLQGIVKDFDTRISSLDKQFKTAGETSAKDLENRFTDQGKAVEDTTTELKKFKKDTLRKLQILGGGSINRQILISGVDPLTRYTDINLKPGAGTTITYVNNNTTKKVDITITGGGGGSGITRSIATTTVSSTVGATASTDYVVLANAGVQITLPTAVSNTNLYTIKNIGSSSVLVGTTGGQTIDGSTTIIMPVQYTSIDVISDSANWEIT